MGLAFVLSIGSSVVLLAISMIFRISGKLRLTLPLGYLAVAVISTFFTDWTNENEDLVMLGLYILIGLVVVSWIYSIVKAVREKIDERRYNRALEEDVAWQIERARELGITIKGIRVLEDGTVVHADTNEPILPISS